MCRVTVKEVKTRREMRDFIRIADKLYEGCPQYVPDLHISVRQTFDPKKNSALQFSTVKPFVAYRDGECVGRIVGIINPRANEKWKVKAVRFGMIDFIDDREVSAALIQTVEDWGSANGMDTIEGPLGVTDFDKEGMLLTDFDSMGAMTEIYNYPYYPAHVEALGFTKAVDWVQVRIAVPKEVPEKYARTARLSKEMFDLKVRKLTAKEIYDGYGQKIFQLFNEAYSPLFGFTGFDEKQVNDFCHAYIPLVDLRMVPIIENAKGELVSAAVTMGSISHALKRANGRLLPTGWYWLLRALKWHREHTAGLLLIAVRPDYQGLGVNALIFDDLIPLYNELGFRYAETGPQLETNVRELSQWQPLNPQTVKRRRCWIKKINTKTE